MTIEQSSESELEQKIKRTVNFVEGLPEAYRMKCFDILISELTMPRIQPNSTPIPTQPGKLIDANDKNEKPLLAQAEAFKLPIEVRAFITQYKVPEDKLYELFLVGENEITPVYSLKTTKFARGQIQIALLTALENTLKGTSKFEIDAEDVRRRCSDNKCYDTKNYVAHFKHNANLFKSLSDMQHIVISPDGKQELAETIFALTKNDQS